MKENAVKQGSYESFVGCDVIARNVTSSYGNIDCKYVRRLGKAENKGKDDEEEDFSEDVVTKFYPSLFFGGGGNHGAASPRYLTLPAPFFSPSLCG